MGRPSIGSLLTTLIEAIKSYINQKDKKSFIPQNYNVDIIALNLIYLTVKYNAVQFVHLKNNIIDNTNNLKV